MTSRAQSQCAPSCSRYRSPFSPHNTSGQIECDAFPAGIPDEIWTNQLDHRLPLEGDHGLQWLAQAGYDFPEYAFTPEALGRTSLTAAAELTAAAADVMSGAMVALVPAHPADLALEGGEPADQLHLTLLYLGDAVDYPPEAQAQVLQTCRELADGWGTVTAQGFAVAAFNPNGEEPCLVLLCSGNELTELHDAVADEITASPEQHQPWIPHVTLAYTADTSLLPGLVDRTGTVQFDRLRVAFAGQVTDLPLDGAPPEDLPAEPPEAPVEPADLTAAVDYTDVQQAEPEAYDDAVSYWDVGQLPGR